ncbi:polyprotein [Hibiscus bacilliform virus GD1]|uniref:polyprotein n=1 Tax=Hibiscus bacilliform virus GD1 TaxID=1459800 RepID=UPI0003EFCD07|nr:polyprotein [Hibiscus bacilliform virus GD1]AHI90954.1 polyprotein [Hibiscus bacilliform virus GD1]
MSTTTTQTVPPVTRNATRRQQGERETPLFEDQIRDYRNSQRRAYTTQRAVRRLRRRITGRQPYQETLEQEVDPQADLQMSMQERARLVPAEVLYRSRRDTIHHRVYSHRSEEAILCTDGNQVDRTFIQPESMEALQRTGISFIHIGIMQVRLQILHRQNEGTMALVVFRDTRWNGDQSIFATMEVDLTEGRQIIYVVPDTMMTIGDFARNIQISILTRGYSNWQNGEANLLVTRGIVGRLSNTPNVAFAYEIGNVTDYLTSQGVQAIAGRRYDSRELQNQQWILRPPQVERLPQAPKNVDTRNLIDGSISLRFRDYATTSTPELPSYNEQDEEVDPDEEQLMEHVVAAFVEEEPKEIWDTLGQPSGKFDFLVKYSAPASSKIRIEDIVPTGWGDEWEQPEQQQSPQQQQLLSCSQEESDDEDDWVSRFQFLAQFDEEPATQPQSPQSPTWYNPFAEGGGSDENDENPDPEESEEMGNEMGYETEVEEQEEKVAMIQEDPDLLPYPHLRELLKNEEKVFSTQQSEVSSYRPPQDTAMTPAGYAPARGEASSSTHQPMFEGYMPRRPQFKQDRSTEYWQFPTAQGQTGAMFVIPRQIGLFHDAFNRWESITKNYVASQGFTDSKDKAEFMENLLGETEKLTWVQWRMNFPTEYQEMVNAADGREGTQNILSQMRRVFTLEDPTTGSTAVQDEAYRDLERLSCTNIKDIVSFLNDYARLAAKSGRMFISPELSEKLWLKMPYDLGNKIRTAYEAKHEGNTIGVFPRILFTYKYLEQECKEAAFRRSLKNLSFCSEMPLPGYYGEKKRYGVRRSTTYKGKPHPTHARIEKQKHLVRNKRCKCYLCGEMGHFARECPNDKKNTRRVAMYEQLNIPEGFEVVSVEEGEEVSDAIFSISENEDEDALHTGGAFAETIFMFHEGTDNVYWAGKKDGYLPYKRITREQFQCEHEWQMNQEVATVELEKCSFCKQETRRRMRLHCPKCRITSCVLCSSNYCGIAIKPEPVQTSFFNEKSLLTQQQEYIAYQTAEIKKLQEQLKQTEEKLAEAERKIRGYENMEVLEKERKEMALKDMQRKIDEEIKKAAMQELPTEKELWEQREGKAHIAGAVIAASTETGREERRPVKGNMLYNMDVEIDIPSVPRFTVKAILDTGATSCCISMDKIPKAAIEPNTFEVTFRGINSVQKSNKKLKYGQMRIGGHMFRIPYTYCFESLTLGDDVQYVLGCNFIRNMHGGVRLEGTEVTFYKNITTIQTRLMAPIVEEDDEDDEVEQETNWIRTMASSTMDAPYEKLRSSFGPLMKELKDQGYIGENPMKHWARNKVLCYLDIKNPDMVIEDKPIKHVTPQMEESFRKHIKGLLELKVIRPSTSKHRTTAFIVNSGTSVDPVTGKETKGKERMVFNYKRLNDLTEKDQYSLPGINTIMKRVGHAKIYSKFDLKSGFHQVAMHPESIKWTAFWVPDGLYEWLVMPFGLKNAPAVFQRKMDNVFKGTEAFIAVYIDDILVFSQSEEEHIKHIRVMLEKCRENGLVLSPTKMKIAQRKVEFLGAILEAGRIQLQPHIIKKVVNFKDEDLQETKGLRSFLGLLNYARAYIPQMGRLLSPLYAKVSPKGEKKLNKEDWKLVRQIKEQVQQLPDLELPPQECFIILETDGCMEGWGGVCKWKKKEYDPKNTERICAYASGKFHPIKSTIDAEIHAVMNSLEAFKIHYLDKPSLTIRTDCQAIIAFFDTISNHKPSRLRWINFTDYVTGLGIPVNFQHVKGEDNRLADALSRLISVIFEAGQQWQEESTRMQHLTQLIGEHYKFEASGKKHHQLKETLTALITSTMNSWTEKSLSSTQKEALLSDTRITSTNKWPLLKDKPVHKQNKHSNNWKEYKDKRRTTSGSQRQETTGPVTGYHPP